MEECVGESEMVKAMADTGHNLERTPEPSRSPMPAGLAVGRRILLVDDEKAVRDVLSKILSAMGFKVTVARNGIEGFNLFLESAFDLVMTDSRMPGMDGWTLAVYVKNRSPRTPVILMTGEREEIIGKKLQRSCVDAAMFKPFRLEEIDRTVQGLLGKTAY